MTEPLSDGEANIAPAKTARPANHGGAHFILHWKIALACLSVVVFLALFPKGDIAVASIFFEKGKGFVKYWILDWLRSLLPWIIAAALAVSALLEFKRIAPKRSLLFTAACYAIGPGIVVNGIFKEISGRARPSQIAQFGGNWHFSPAFIFDGHCEHNCSFTAGDPSVGFALIAFAFLFPKYRLPLSVAALIVGFGFGAIRIVQGGHFLSDVFASAAFTILTAMMLSKIILREGARGN